MSTFSKCSPIDKISAESKTPVFSESEPKHKSSFVSVKIFWEGYGHEKIGTFSTVVENYTKVRKVGALLLDNSAA